MWSCPPLTFMARPRSTKRIVPVVLGLAMLAVVVAAGLTPNTGVVQAATNTPYNQPSSSGVSPWVYLGIAAFVILAGLLLALFLMRRRRPPSTAPPPTLQTWQEGPAPPPPPGGAPPSAAPAYLETPEDVSRVPPVVAGAGVPAGAGTAAAAGGEPDIDSLMAELDKISGEILKRAPKKSPGSKAGEEIDEGTSA
jgi:hypothetical protein